MDRTPRLSVVPALSKETVEALERMLREARAGRLIGIAGVCLYRDQTYAGELIGATKEHPTYAIGMLRVVEEQILRSIELDSPS